MTKEIVFMFSGQGSQYYQMGRELYDNNPRFKLWMDHCDKLVQPLIHTSLIDILYKQKKKSEPFDQILYTSPALLCIEYSLAQVIMEMGFNPDYLLGYSLGEITASVVSGSISFGDGLQLVVDYARLLEKKSPSATMLAIIDSVDVMVRFPDLLQNCWIAGRNCNKSFVVSGLVADIECLQTALYKENIMTQKLPVNYGFHTELMDPFEEQFKRLVQKINLSPIGIPIISALKAEQIQEVSAEYLWEVFRYPVEFQKTIHAMLQQEDYIFVDVGPSGILATFVKYLLPAGSGSLQLETINQFGKDLFSIEKLKVYLPTVV